VLQSPRGSLCVVLHPRPGRPARTSPGIVNLFPSKRARGEREEVFALRCPQAARGRMVISCQGQRVRPSCRDADAANQWWAMGPEAERRRWAWPGDLTRCLEGRADGWAEASSGRGCSETAAGDVPPLGAGRARSTRGTYGNLLSSLRKNFFAAHLSRQRWTKISNPCPS
jgi:hypothetical protein